VQKRKPAMQRENPAVLPFRPPPGLAPPEAALNPFAEVFDPSTCFAASASCLRRNGQETII